MNLRFYYYSLFSVLLLDECNGFDFSKIQVRNIFIKSSLDNIASSHLVYSSFLNIMKEELLSQENVLSGIYNFQNYGLVESFFLYGIFTYFLHNEKGLRKKTEKFERFERYYKYRKVVRNLLFVCLFVFTKNIENAI